LAPLCTYIRAKATGTCDAMERLTLRMSSNIVVRNFNFYSCVVAQPILYTPG